MVRIGFVGLGHMGLPMAICLLKAGHKVVGYDLQPSAMHDFSAAGGQTASTLADTAKNQDIIITMLQKGQQVLDACLEKEGLFAKAQTNTLFIDCSTIDVASSRQIHEQALKHGFSAVDAPVSGGVAAATAGNLTFMVGGNAEGFKAAQRVLSAMGQKIIHTGPATSGQVAKICNNMILGVSMIAISEAFILGEQLGLPAEKLFEVVNNASGQCWAMTKYVPVPNLLEHVPANNQYKPGFTANMMLKDLLLSQTAARQGEVTTPMGAKAAELYEDLVEQGLGESDFSVIIKLIAKTLEA